MEHGGSRKWVQMQVATLKMAATNKAIFWQKPSVVEGAAERVEECEQFFKKIQIWAER